MRQGKVEWLLDQYVTTKSLYPDAPFYYVGHSNGTYLAASALLQCEAVRFDRIVFAGSVVRRDFAWRRLIDQGQVKRVLNYVATADWVVAIFPKALQTVNWQDLGSAGHDGFNPGLGEVVEIEYVPGAHAAALKEQNWNGIADFIVNDGTPRPTDLPKKRDILTKLAGWGSPVLFASAVLLVLAAGFGLLYPLFDSPNWYFAILFAAYLALVRLVATKV